MTKKREIKEKSLLEKLYKSMHTWWWLGVVFDWDFNKENGKCWVYKDCTGVEIKATSLETLEQWLAWRNLSD